MIVVWETSHEISITEWLLLIWDFSVYVTRLVKTFRLPLHLWYMVHAAHGLSFLLDACTFAQSCDIRKVYVHVRRAAMLVYNSCLSVFLVENVD